MAQTLEAVFFQGAQERDDHVPGAAVANGTILNLGTGRVGIVTTPGGLEANRMGSVAVTGKFKVKKALATTFARGVVVDWDDAAKLAVAAGTFAVGTAAYAAVNGDDHVVVDVNNHHPA